jgi:hypothetical protein
MQTFIAYGAIKRSLSPPKLGIPLKCHWAVGPLNHKKEEAISALLRGSTKQL